MQPAGLVYFCLHGLVCGFCFGSGLVVWSWFISPSNFLVWLDRIISCGFDSSCCWIFQFGLVWPVRFVRFGFYWFDICVLIIFGFA